MAVIRGSIVHTDHRRAPDGLKDFNGPLSRAMKEYLPIQPADGWRDAWQKRSVGMIGIYKFGFSTENALMNTKEILQQEYADIASIWETYDKQLHNFRSQVKNDVASIEASGNKTVAALGRMNKAYNEVFQQLNSDDMLRAIQNAERLSAALQSINSLTNHKLTFAVIGNEKKE